MYPAGGLCPGVVAHIYGLNMAATTAYTKAVPLQTSSNGTYVLVGTKRAPLFYISAGTVDVQIPSELAPGQYLLLVVTANGNSIPQTITLGAVAPGIATSVDGYALARDFSFVSRQAPAHPGDYVSVYLVGMGATKPAVASGSQPSGSTLPTVNVMPAVTVDGQKAKILFAGLTKFSVGLYQIVFQIPLLAREGDLPLVVSQSGASANAATITVHR